MRGFITTLDQRIDTGCCKETDLVRVDARRIRTVGQPIDKTSKYGLTSFKYQSSKLWSELETRFKVFSQLEDFKECM